MKYHSVKLYNIYGAIVHQVTLLAPDGVAAFNGALVAYFNRYPNISTKMLKKGINKFTCEVL